MTKNEEIELLWRDKDYLCADDQTDYLEYQDYLLSSGYLFNKDDQVDAMFFEFIKIIN